MKYLVIILALIVLAASAYWAFARTAQGPMDAAAGPAAPASAAVPADGTYTVLSEESRVSWAGKKPLIDGYVNTGSIAISEGTVTVAGEEATGAFTLDLDTLSVSATPTK